MSSQNAHHRSGSRFEEDISGVDSTDTPSLNVPPRERSDTHTVDDFTQSNSHGLPTEPPPFYNPTGLPPYSRDPSRTASRTFPSQENDSLLPHPVETSSIEPKGPSLSPWRRCVLFFTSTPQRIVTRLVPFIFLVLGILVIVIGVPIILSRKPVPDHQVPNETAIPLAVNLLSTPVGSPSVDEYDNGPRLVFAHYMLITPPPNYDYTPDVEAAQAAGIDAFAVNYGGVNVDPYFLRAQLQLLYDACAARGFSAFISIDTTSTAASGDPITSQEAVDLFNDFAAHPAQLRYNGAALLSSFQTSDHPWDWRADVLSRLNASVHFLPGTLNSDGDAAFSLAADDGAAGYFSWIHHTMDPDLEAQADASFAAARNRTTSPQSTDLSTGAPDGRRKWMASLAPWFYKRLGAHWAAVQGPHMFLPRALDLLRRRPDYLQLVTWNDFGESTYLGPPNGNLSALCPGCGYAGLPHDGFRAMLAPVLRAFRAGEADVRFDAAAGDREQAWLYYRLHPAATGPVGDRPSGWSRLDDRVYVVAFVGAETTVTVTTTDAGGAVVRRQALRVGRGLSVVEAEWAAGRQTVMATRGSEVVVPSRTGPAIVEGMPPDGYNGNVVVV